MLKLGLKKNHTLATYNKKKKAAKTQATLKANLALLLFNIAENDDAFSHVKLGTYRHDLLSNDIDTGHATEPCNILSITNSVMHFVNIPFKQVHARKIKSSLPQIIDMIEYESLLEIFL